MPATLPPSFVEPLGTLELALRQAVGVDPSPIAAAARYVMGWEDESGRPTQRAGKRQRPLLCLLAARAMGATGGEAMPGAVAVELVHNFSLVHDEVQDGDDTRHGRPTVYKIIGPEQAINVGDFLYTRAIRALSESEGSVNRRMDALRVLNRAIERMVRGQWQDLAFEKRLDVTSDEYLAMVAGKTGALLGAPLEMGALLAGAPPGQAALLGGWGEAVGLAFQMQDDYLGVWGDAGTTGKPVGYDIARRKKTLPVILGLSHPQAGPVLQRVFASDRPDAQSIGEAVDALTEANTGQACRIEARRHLAAADELLADLELPSYLVDEFRAIADFQVDRNF